MSSTPQAPAREPGQVLPDYLLEAARAGDPLVRLGPRGQRYLLHHPDAVKHMLQDNHRNYLPQTPKRPLMGHRSLTMATGDAWRQRRRLMQPFFQPQRLAESVGHAAEVTEAMLERWRGAAEAGQTLDIAGEMAELSLDTLIATLLGRESAAQSELKQRVHQAFEYFNARARRGGRALPLWLPTPGNRRIKSALRAMRQSVLRRITEGRRRGEDQGDLLSKLILAEDPRTGAILSDEDLLDEMMMLLVMGHMTTATALAWTWYLLARHPAVEGRLVAELEELGARRTAQEDEERLSYTRRVVEEVLRLYPSTWLFGRRAEADDVVAGIPIPAGATLMVSPYVTHRRSDLWSEPEHFDPDRFLPERAGDRHRFAYFPFGGGPRACIANHLVLREVPLIVARVARRYRLERDSDDPVGVRAVITLEPRGGLPMRILPRDSR